MNDERDEASNPDEARALRALEAAERLDPPKDFVPGVMRQLSPRTRVLVYSNPKFWTPRMRWQASGGGGMSTKKVLLGIAAVAVLAIGYFSVTGFPPTGPGSEGTVGAAKKYQSEQISAKDVQLQNPEIQRVLQSDTFHKLVTNPQTRAILTSKEFQKAMAAAEVQGLLHQAAENADLAQKLESAMESKAVGGLVHYLSNNSEASAALGAALDNAAVDKALDAAGGKTMENAAGQVLDAAQYKALDAAINQAVQDSVLERLLSQASRDPAFAGLLGNESFQDALQNPAFTGLLADPAFGKAIGDKAFLDSISNPAFLGAATSGALGAAIDKATDGAQGKAQDGAQGR